jgi:hypothetical protein
LGRRFGVLGPGNRIPPEAFNRLAVIGLPKGFDALDVPAAPNPPAPPITFHVIDQPLIEPSQKGILGYANAMSRFNRAKHNPKSSKVNVSIFNILTNL